MENNDHFFLTFKSCGVIICSVLHKHMNTFMKQVNMQKSKTEENNGVQTPWRPEQFVCFVEKLKVKTHVCVLFTSIEIFRENVFFFPFSYPPTFGSFSFCFALLLMHFFPPLISFFPSSFRFGTKFSTNEPLSFVWFLFYVFILRIHCECVDWIVWIKDISLSRWLLPDQEPKAAQCISWTSFHTANKHSHTSKATTNGTRIVESNIKSSNYVNIHIFYILVYISYIFFYSSNFDRVKPTRDTRTRCLVHVLPRCCVKESSWNNNSIIQYKKTTNNKTNHTSKWTRQK